MVVAHPRLAQRRLARARAHADGAGPEGHAHEGFEKLRDVGVSEAEIAVPPLAFDGH